MDFSLDNLLYKKNFYIAMQYKEYLQRHPNATFLRKCWCVCKYWIINKKNGRFVGKILTDREIEQKICKHKIISFDIFDTLLLRPYEKPTDLFYEIGKYYGDENFYYARIRAERKAREKFYRQEEVTFDQIYEEIEEKYKGFYNKELDWERKVLYKNEEVNKLFRYALDNKKKIVICSDMYLPLKFLMQVLHLNGYEGISDYYISSEYMKTKASGNLFRCMVDKLEISPEHILHIGDNTWSDGNAYRKYGIDYVGIYEHIKWGYVGSPNNIKSAREG